jgi:hypothetical protein
VDLADIVEDAGQGESVEIYVAQSQAPSQVDREVGDPMDVTVEVLDHVFHDLDQNVPW